MKIFALIILFISLMANTSFAHTVFAPDNKNLKVHWAVLEAKSGKMSEMSAISARTVAKFTPHESGSYSLYGGLDKANPDLMRILEIYEDEAAYQVHRASEGFKAFISEREPILQSLKILPVDPVVLEQKESGVGKCVYMTLIEVKPEKLDEFKALITREVTRAVSQESGVLGLFATSEQGARNNFIHTLEIYSDEDSHARYLESESWKSYRTKADELIISRKVFENLPANIILSRKGLHLNMMSEFKNSDPEFYELFTNFAGKEVISQSKLDPRTRYMAIIATLMGCQGLDEFKAILPYALEAGLTPSECKEIIYQGTAYLGIGRTRAFLTAANEIFTSRGIKLPLEDASTTTPENRIEKGNDAQVKIFGDGMKGFQNSGSEETRHINRWLAGNCFGDYYTRKGLDLRERELITFCYIAAQGGCEPQLTAHAKGNITMGNDKAFLIDVISQCLPYIGYPRSLNALTCINKAGE